MKMPPKTRITRDMIINASVEVIRQSGFENINARNVSGRLRCSTQPVMYHFSTIDSLKRAVNKHLRDNRRRIYIDSIHEDGSRSKVVSRQVQTLAYLADVIKPSERSIFRKYIKYI